jgi:hypothetical protein
VRNRLSNLQSFFPERTSFSEHAEFGVTHGEEGQGLHRRQRGLTKTLTPLFIWKRCDGLPEAIDPLPVSTLSPVGGTKVEMCQGMHNRVSASGRERQGALASGDSLVIRARVAEMNGQIARNVSQPPMIGDGHGEDLGLA